MASRALTVLFVVGLLVTGSLNTISVKIAFSMTGISLDGQPELFQKPWFVTFIMFLAMMLALPCHSLVRYFTMRKLTGPNAPLIDASPDYNQHGQKGISWSKKVLLVSVPAVFDILATGLCSTGFLYIPASVWQLLRGAEMIFAAILAVLCLGRTLYLFHWLGLWLAVSGIILVGLASVWGDESQPSTATKTGEHSSALVLLGMGLALAGQVVQAAQVIAEEWLLKDVDLPGLEIIGFEGVWGALIMLVAVFPLIYLLPGGDHGHLEDEWDAISLVQSSQPLFGMVLVYTASCSVYNMAGIAVTGALSAVHRVMLEALRTTIVWAFGLTVHYCVDKKSRFGEAWTPYSWYEVAGFVVLMLGQAIYGQMLRIPGLSYPPEEEDEPFPSPGSLKNLASPLPPARG